MIATALSLPVPAVLGESRGDYVSETDPLVLQKLEQWQDWKFGIMMHWGPYSQWGVIESWPICSEAGEWNGRPENVSYVDYVREYEQLPTSFNPVHFDPETWAEIAQAAGTRYVVFTTKHHDGFSMFDTAQTDYRITAPNVPFHSHLHANITKAVFDAFRKQGFGIGAYLSKPDWHSDYYWWRRFATPTRHVNYDPSKYPERWRAFVEFTHAQVDELTRDYGRVDILWLDGGWVRKRDSREETASGIAGGAHSEDIDMAGMAALGRRNQPGLIVVDRSVGGLYENYRTPEQKIPELPLSYPWETCMTLGDSWSYKPNDSYKSSRSIVQMLVDVVAKGGNYLLNVGPQPDGRLPSEAVQRLREVGAWMAVNGPAIYGSRAVAPYKDGKFRYTRLPNGDVYAIYLPEEGEAQLPEELNIPGPAPREGTALEVLGSETALQWQREGDSTLVRIPDEVRRATANSPAWAIRLTGAVANSGADA